MNKGFSKKIHRSPMIEKNYRLAPKIPKMKNARCNRLKKSHNLTLLFRVCQSAQTLYISLDFVYRY